MFTWVDFAEDDRRKMADVIALFSERDTRDQLGASLFFSASFFWRWVRTLFTRTRG